MNDVPSAPKWRISNEELEQLAHYYAGPKDYPSKVIPTEREKVIHDLVEAREYISRLTAERDAALRAAHAAGVAEGMEKAAGMADARAQAIGPFSACYYLRSCASAIRAAIEIEESETKGIHIVTLPERVAVKKGLI